ncbi:MAG: hypothetical protein JW818_05360 [Pirellulales bacterium]|nr:hypothetical protein [Pirellulales bacterium]
MLSILGRNLALWLAIGTVVGCARVNTPRAQSPLRQPEMSTDSVVLDIFFVRFPYGDPDVNEALWREIDEQHLPPECRRQLLENGFRAGIIAGGLPARLSELMKLADKPAPSGHPTEMTPGDLVGEPTVLQRHLQIRAGARGEILASDVRDELPVLMRDALGRLSGQSYAQAQPVLAIRPVPEPDGRVRLDVVPEVHYGPVRPCRVVGDGQGMLRFEPSRQRRVFDKLALEAVLSPGHMLMMSSLPTRRGSLGHHFFTVSHSGKQEQKLLIIRLSQTQHDDQFDQAASVGVYGRPTLIFAADASRRPDREHRATTR